MASKDCLREIYRRKRGTLSDEERAALSLSICRAVTTSEVFIRSSAIHVFLPIKRLCEIDTMPIANAVWNTGKTLVVSVSDFASGNMTNYAAPKDTVFTENSWGIPEPENVLSMKKIWSETIDMVIVPLLAYDTRGARVGYGRGFYDRFLSACRADTVKAGVSFFPPEENAIEDTTDDDIPLDCCFTPHGCLRF